MGEDKVKKQKQQSLWNKLLKEKVEDDLNPQEKDAKEVWRESRMSDEDFISICWLAFFFLWCLF